MRRRAPVARPAVGGQGRWNCDALPSRISSDGTRLLRLSSLAALLFSTFFGGAHAGTVINGYWLETNCNPTPARPQAIQVAFPGQCGAETPCNSIVFNDIGISQVCPLEITTLNLTGSPGVYFTATDFSAANCSGNYTFAAAVLPENCIPLAALGLPGFGYPQCPDGPGNGTLQFFADEACKTPIAGLQRGSLYPGGCETFVYPVNGQIWSMTGYCVNVTASPVWAFPTVASATSSPTASPIPNSGSTPIGAIVGGVIGGLAAVGLAAGGLVYYRSRKAKENAGKNSMATDAEAGEKAIVYDLDKGPPGSRPSEALTVTAASASVATIPSTTDMTAVSQMTVPSSYFGPASAALSVPIVSTDGPMDPLPRNPMYSVAPSESVPAPAVANNQGKAAIPPVIATPPAAPVVSRVPSMPDPDSPLTAVAGSKFVVRAEDVIVDKSKILGKGNFGVVYEGVLRGSVKVAVKVARREFDVDAARAFAKEIKNWEGLAQRNVLPLIAFTIDPPMLISEIADGGNLREYLKSRSWPRDQGLRLLCDVARGMSYLHSFGILHGDLKCANVLVDAAAGRALVSDFGLSKFRQPGDGSVSIGGPDAHVPGGTVGFMAPEIMMGEPLRPPADVFSFAMLCYEVVSNGLYPFGGAPNYWAVSYAVTSKGARPDRPADVLDSVWAVMERSWAQEPADRPTFPKVGEELEAIAAATK